MTAQLDSTLLTLLDGMVELKLLCFADPAKLAAARAETGSLATTLAESGDRLTAPGNFGRDRDRHRIRSEALNAASTALALGALQPGGITWCGRHWCTAPHDDCPTRPGRTTPHAHVQR